jgi:predicted aminopeptidase
MVTRVRESGWLARAVLVAALLAVLEGCGSTYVAQAARGQWQVMRERRPIGDVIADPGTSQALRDKLSLVTEARGFASRELGLPDNDTYRSYTDLKRSYVVWNVVAVPEFSVTPQRWCFPIAGCVAYRGYFTESKARAFAERLRRKHFDVTVGGVAAYSTLGRFADPVLSTMTVYGEHELAAIMFHELAHQVAYVAGDSAFNEGFAVTVEQAGLERWLAYKGQEGELARLRAGRARHREHLALLERYREQLAALYARELPAEAMRARKRATLAALEAELRRLAERQTGRGPYAGWIEEGLNNAHLASIATYFDCVPGFQRLLATSGGDLPVFYARVRRLARLPKMERHAGVCEGVASAEPASGEQGSERQGLDAEARTPVLPANTVHRQ